MTRTWLIALALAGPATAQQVAGPGVTPRPTSRATAGEVARGAPINGVLVLYGNQRCPTDAAGNEVVVCQRRDAAEQYRVPKELRDFQVTPENQAWAAKAQGTLAAGDGVSTIGSCSVVGAGGQSGCLAPATRANRSENVQRRTEASRVP